MSVLTVSRQFGAGGKTLSKLVAEKMNYTFVDEEIIQLVAEKARVSTNWVESIEKEAGGKLHKFLSGLVPKSFVERILDDDRGYIDEEIYVDALQSVITKIAETDNSVILGRGGQYILRDREDTFHIILMADKDDRVRFMEKHYNLSPSQALQTVNGNDKRRMNLYRKFGREDYNSPHLYHLVLNTSKLSIEKAVELVCDLINRNQ
ncbi:MAG: cytidylate kinase-like family protein [Desulfobacterales bacterium]|nr:cytidylate kinase-like family protein [Desulfobacterales bacterium]